MVLRKAELRGNLCIFLRCFCCWFGFRLGFLLLFYLGFSWSFCLFLIWIIQRDLEGTFAPFKMSALKHCLCSTLTLIYSKDLTEYITKLFIQVPKVTFLESRKQFPLGWEEK